ncbi:MAG: tetratricopeptide repeat protein [Planctomycetota bacterium]|jgi:tetratricopeptide (TPR) repeat protein
MASKRKKRSKGRLAVTLIDHVKRNLERGDFKQALKDVRVCYRQNPTSDCRCFLEHAYIGRAQQLLQKGLIEDSRRIVRDLLDLGVTELAVEAGLPDLLLSVGMFDCLPQGDDALTDEERDRLRVKAADQAVVQPRNTPKSMPEVREDAQRIRAALEAVERGDELVALGYLRDIPRQSLFADWKYFVRGLIAYYRRDKTGMAANWSRLDADRAATGIAAPLKVVAGMAPPRDDGNMRSKVSRLENQVTNGAVLGRLTRLRQSTADRDWPLLLKTLRAGQRTLRETDEGVYRRLVSCLCGILVHDGLVEELEQFSRIVDPLPIDPRWNRAKAIACEYSDFDDEDPEEYWRNYLRDLENLPTLLPAQRDLARGLVWLRLAEYYVNDAVDLRGCRCGADHRPYVKEAEKRARGAFEQCFTLAPAYAPAYVAAATFHTIADRSEEAAKVHQRLLEHVPDHLDALFFLAEYHVSHGEGLKAHEFALRAHELKPLGKKTRGLLWATHTEAACELARTEQYDKARGEVTAADRLQPARTGDYDVLARKAVLEIKAGNPGAARRFVEQAQEQLDEPTALWLVMTIEAIRYDLPWQEVCLYEKRWCQALKRRCCSETAGLMCHVLDAHLRMPQPYPQHQEHTRNLLQYVRRCSRVKWRPEDLRHVCEFLEQLEELELLTKFAKRGIRKCPEIGYFHWLMGMAEIGKGPFRYNRRLTVERLQRAIELASKSSDPRDKQVVENAKRFLSLAESVSHHHDEYRDDDLDECCEDGCDGQTDGTTIDELQDVIQRVCRKLGLDPEVMLDELRSDRPDKSR